MQSSAVAKHGHSDLVIDSRREKRTCLKICGKWLPQSLGRFEAMEPLSVGQMQRRPGQGCARMFVEQSFVGFAKVAKMLNIVGARDRRYERIAFCLLQQSRANIVETQTVYVFLW